MLNQIKQYALQQWQLDLDRANQLSAVQLSNIAQQFGLTQEQCLFELLPLAAQFALVPVSNFHVGAIAVGVSGTAYFGANIEFAGAPLGQTIHAEQAAINAAWLAEEKGITDIYVNESPCGHCRQFMNELVSADSLQVHVQSKQKLSLHQLLPHAFGPNDLGIVHKLMAVQAHQQPGDQFSADCEAIWQLSYAPYSQSPAVCIITLDNGERYCGAYAENAAFNPSLAPLQSALIQLRMAGKTFEQIDQVELYEAQDGKISQCEISYALLQVVAPHAEWLYAMV